jgi:hypothetical protein
MDLGEVGWVIMDLVDLAQDMDVEALVDTIMNLKVP